jgi:osmotically-inducible protein OsmY
LDQSNKRDDVRITAEIRQKIVNHEGMSINGRNVKVITDGGDVTLRGPVASQEEKDTIEKFAKDSARGKVDNQLEVAP